MKLTGIIHPPAIIPYPPTASISSDGQLILHVQYCLATHCNRAKLKEESGNAATQCGQKHAGRPERE